MPPFIFNKSARSSIFFPLIVIPLGMLPTKRAQSTSPEASFISEKFLTVPKVLKPQSSNSIREPSSLDTTWGTSTRFKLTFTSDPKVSPLANLVNKA